MSLLRWEMPWGMLTEHKLAEKATADIMHVHGFSSLKKKFTKETKKIWGGKNKRKKKQVRKKREIRFLNTRYLQKKFSPPNFLFSSFFLLTPTLRKCLRFKSNKYQPHKKSVYPIRISLAMLPTAEWFPLCFFLLQLRQRPFWSQFPFPLFLIITLNNNSRYRNLAKAHTSYLNKIF